MRGDLFFQLFQRRCALPDHLGLLDEPLLPLDPGLHLPRRKRIDTGRMPGLPPLGLDLLELLRGGSLLAAEFCGLLLQGKLLGLKRRPIGHAVRFAAEPVGQIVGPADDLLVGRGQIECIRHTPCAGPQRHTTRKRVPRAGHTGQKSLQGRGFDRFLPPLLQHESPAGVAELAGGGQLRLRRHFALQPQSLQFALDVGRIATGLFQLTVQAGDPCLGIGEVTIETGDRFRRRQGQFLQDFQRSAPQSQLVEIDRGLLCERGNLGPQGGRLLREVALAACLADGLGQRGRIARWR